MAVWNREQVKAQLQASPLAQRWQHMARRERVMLGGLAVFLLSTLLYLGVWHPVANQKAEAQLYLQQQRELHAYLQARTPEIVENQRRPVVSLEPARLQGLVTASATEKGLAVERLDSEGSGGVQVSLQPAGFDRLLSWLDELQALGVRIEEAGLDRQGDGRIAARLTLRVAL
jgi:general secretion pathway protein M